MEERQTKIREGAGLEESRLNTEFIEWMQRYSAPLLVAIAVVAGGYAGWNYLKRQREHGQDQAFVELQSAASARSPVALVRVAEEHASRGAVPTLARLAAADLHLEAFRTGVKAGIQLKPDGSLPEGEKFLTEDERAAELVAAADLYTQVAAQTEGSPSASLLTVGALSGLASVAECRGSVEDAKAAYERTIAAAKAAGYDDLATLAQRRIDSLNKFTSTPKLYAAADLPKKPTTFNSPGGGAERFMKVRMNEAGQMEPIEDPNAVPPATPATPTAPPTPAPGEPGNGADGQTPASPAPAAAPPGEPAPGDKPGSGTPKP